MYFSHFFLPQHTVLLHMLWATFPLCCLLGEDCRLSQCKPGPLTFPSPWPLFFDTSVGIQPCEPPPRFVEDLNFAYIFKNMCELTLLYSLSKNMKYISIDTPSIFLEIYSIISRESHQCMRLSGQGSGRHSCVLKIWWWKQKTSRNEALLRRKCCSSGSSLTRWEGQRPLPHSGATRTISD